MAVTGASLTPIYNRLHGLSGHHPGGSNIFSDPSLRAGDIVSMVQDGVTYQTPVMVNRSVWKGGFVSAIDSPGEKERLPVEKMAQRKYSGGGGYRVSGRFSHQLIHNDEELTSIYTKTGINALGEDETLYSRISQTADSITTEVAASESRTYTLVRQTKEDIEAEIVSAISGDFGPLLTDIYASISGLQTEVGRKSRVYVQLTDPALTYTVHDGDFWIVDTLKRKFSDFNAGETFASVNGFRWTDYYGSVINVRKNGKWIETANSQMDVLNNTKIEEDREHISLIASKLTETESQYAELKVEASQIRAEVIDAKTGLESSLTQTASQIRAEVTDKENGLRSALTVTASQIRGEVEDSTNGLRTSITQTASQIRAEVSDDVNSLRSSITATASQIRAEVNDDVNSLRSEIEQNASAIRLKVSYGEVATRLAVECGNVRVSGGDLIVEGMVSASSVYSAIAGIETVQCADFNANSGTFNFSLKSDGEISAQEDISSEHDIHALGNFYASNNGDTERQLKISDISVSGNTMTITKIDGTTIPFSKATSLSGAWSSGKLTVTASPQNEKFERTLQAGNPSWSGGLCTIPINAVWGSSGQYSESTNWNVYANINKSDIGFTSDGFVQAGQDPHIPSGAIQLSQNLGMPANNYGYYKFHITVNGQRKDYYCSVDTR